MKTLIFKKNLLLFISILLLGAIIISTGSCDNVKNINPRLMSQYFNKTLFVGGTGPDNYTNIHEALQEAQNGDTIFVFNGSYPAEIIIDKKIRLVGESRDNTIIEWGQDGIEIHVDGVEVKGFTIRKCGEFCNHCAIYVGSNDNIIRNNKILDNGKLNGIFLQDSDNNLVIGNIFENNPYHAIRMEYSNYNIISKNYINDNEGYGIFVVDSSNNIFELNTVSSNFWGGITVGEYCENNIFYHNNVINNIINGNDNGKNIWNETYPSGGNYWSDYSGKDDFKGPNQDIPGSDGIGDTPYDLPCEHAIDYYPLIDPVGIPYAPIISGELNGRAGVEYEYNFFIKDPEKDDLYLRVDWGNGIPSRWLGPYNSDSNVKLKYSWNDNGRYLIRAQAKDINGIEGHWGYLDVNMPKTIIMKNDFQVNICRSFSFMSLSIFHQKFLTRFLK